MRSVSLGILLMALAAPASATDRGLGLVTQNNVAAMLVNPNPTYAGVKIEGGSGTGADAAVSRYRKGAVKPLLPLSGKSDLGVAGAAGQGSGAAAAQAGGPR
jgi:hypothetical protein